MSKKRDAKGRFLPKGSSGGGKTRRRRRRKNPGNPSVRHYAGRAYHHTRSFLGGLGLGEAAKVTLHGMIGIAAASLLRKKFGSVSSARSNWEWKDYLMAGLGALAASTVSKYLFKASPQTSKNILVGGLVLIGYRILTDEILPKNDTLEKWFGENPEGSWEGLGAGEPAGYLPGDVYMGEDGSSYVYGEDGYWRPIDESHRMMGQDSYYGTAYGALAPPSPLGQEGSYYGQEGSYYGEEPSYYGGATAYGGLGPVSNLGEAAGY